MRTRLVSQDVNSIASIFSLVLILFLTSASAAAQPTYRITDLSAQGWSFVSATDMNDAGQITGWGKIAAGDVDFHAFLWNGTSMVDLGTLGAANPQSLFINATGQVAGSDQTSGNLRAFLWNGTSRQDLGTLGGFYSAPYDINDAGQVTGISDVNGANSHAFLWNGTSMQDLGSLSAQGNSFGSAINASGQVTGFGEIVGGGEFHPIFWDGASLQDLGDPDGFGSRGIDIDDAGRVTGFRNFAKDEPRAFLWNGTSMQDLMLSANPSNPSEINASGQVVGTATLANGQLRAFLWNGTSTVNLGTLGGDDSEGISLNDAGQVTGYSLVSSCCTYHAFLYSGGTFEDLNDRIDPTDPLQPYITLDFPIKINSSGQVLVRGCDSRTGACQRPYLASPDGTDSDADDDGDGIAHSVDSDPVTASNAFDDSHGTSGSIIDRATLTVTVQDAATPDGVRVIVGAGSGAVTLDSCGFTVMVNAGSEAMVTCGSVALRVIHGAAQVVLAANSIVAVPAGAVASVTDNGDGTFDVSNIGEEGEVTVIVNGTETPIGPGDTQTVDSAAQQGLSSLAPAHGWLGLKNSDGQGTAFDLRAELLKNGAPVASGVTRCITGVTRNASLAREAIIPWGAFESVPASSGDKFAIRLSTRIGTNPNDSRCTGPGASHANASGLRFYYDAANRPSRLGATIGSSPAQDLYLHSNGNACANADSSGVTNRFLNTSAPNAANAKCKDSAAVKFTGGNAWKDIGTWSLAPLP